MIQTRRQTRDTHQDSARRRVSTIPNDDLKSVRVEVTVVIFADLQGIKRHHADRVGQVHKIGQ